MELLPAIVAASQVRSVPSTPVGPDSGCLRGSTAVLRAGRHDPWVLNVDAPGQVRFHEVGYASSPGLSIRLWWVRETADGASVLRLTSVNLGMRLIARAERPAEPN